MRTRFILAIACASFALLAHAQARDGAQKLIEECDRLAAGDIDVERPTSVAGVPGGAIQPVAIPACEAAVQAIPDNRRLIYQLGRAYQTAKRHADARAQYARADALGHVQAAVNLAGYFRNGEGGLRDFEEARRLYAKAAAAGNASAMYEIGRSHELGIGVPKDDAEAKRWYESAAARGWRQAMTRLGWFAREARGGAPQDFGVARRWFEKAAVAGHGQAMISLGLMWAEGLDAPQDYSEARHWYEKAAAAGEMAAITWLGWVNVSGHEPYTKGFARAVPQDYAAARPWFEKAAAAGDTSGMEGLGVIHQHHGDYAEARRWYEKARDAGEQSATDRLRRLDELLRSRQPTIKNSG